MYSVSYQRAGTIAEAAKLLEAGEAKALSGGMTLIPAMKTRLAAPSDDSGSRAYSGAEGHKRDGTARHDRGGDHACRVSRQAPT